MDNRKIFADNLRRFTESSGRTQSEIAAMIGVSRGTFSDWLKGRSYPRINKIQALADMFNVPKSALVEQEYYEEVDTDKIIQEVMQDPAALKLFLSIRKLSEKDRMTIEILVRQMTKEE